MRQIVLKLRACRNKSLSSLVALIFRKILDKSSREVFCFFLPLGSVRISVARIKDAGIYPWELCRDFKVEVWDLLRRRILNIAV